MKVQMSGVELPEHGISRIGLRICDHAFESLLAL